MVTRGPPSCAISTQQRCKIIIRFWRLSAEFFYFARDVVNGKPFKVPMRGKTTSRYIQSLTCLLAFILRVKSGQVKGYIEELTLAQPLSRASDILLQSLKCPGDQISLSDAIHSMVMSILHEPRVLPFRTSSSLSALFIVFSNVLASGMIKHPEEIRGTLSELKWTLRASAFVEIVRLLRSGDSDLVDASGVDDIITECVFLI